IRLFQLIAPGLREDFPPLKTLDARPNNLPVQLTSFIGRVEVMQQLKSLLKQTRLLTILGPGGAGKTRLSLQAGADLIDEFANGVFITELAHLSDPSFILQTLMNSLGVKEEKGRSPEDSLIDHLKNKEMLLILDNCEHLINECAKLSEKLLKNCQKLKIITTSREALNCSGELSYRLSSMSHPDPSVNNTAEQLTQFEAVRLFIERALSVKPDFRVNNENAPALAGICSRLDGIPLAIELAAARIKILTPEKIHERLDDRFSLLTGGKRTALPRQQTLRAMIDWSYDLLSDKERVLWNRLSVFSGGWDFEAAEFICQDEKISEKEIFDLLINLNEKSIILFDEDLERFRMLETIRQYGEVKLNEENEFEIVSERHLDHYVKFAETAESFLSGHEAQSRLNKLDIERGNLERSMLYALKTPEEEKGIRLASALGSFWKIRGHYSEGRQWLEKLLEINKDISKPVLGKALCKLGKLVQLQGELDASVAHLNKSMEINEALNNKNLIAEAMNNLGIIKFEQGDYESAKNYYSESLKFFKETDDKKNIAYTINDLGSLLLEKGEYENAAKLFEESVEIQREAGEKRGVAYSLFNLGNIIMEQGDLARCAGIFDECIVLFKELEEKRGTAYSLCSLGNIAFSLGEIEKATILLDESIALFRMIGEKRGISFALTSRANISIQDGDFETTSVLLEESLAIGQETDNKPIIAYSLMTIGNAEYSKGNRDKAKKYFEDSLELSTEIGHKPGIAFNLNYLGNIALSNGEIKLAADLFSKSLTLNKELNQKKELAVNLLGFSELKFAKEEYTQTVLLLGFLKEFSGTIKVDLQKTESARLDSLYLKLKEKLGNKDYLKYFEEGKKITMDEACVIAISKD
ncbi:MAG: tetratricopeptide repeat protein, partial [Ignavibacteria bacterium]|nr:tetratricopeptide repeat protein [Ignavibacteria bacterium]